MDKPRCKLCDTQHYASEPHAFESKPANKRVSTVNTKRLAAQVNKPRVQPSFELEAEIGRLKARIAELEAENALLRKPKRDRKAYMREYMRRRRANAD